MTATPDSGPTPTVPRQRNWAALAALGIVYGDLGTSPLYTLKECLIAAGGGEATTADLFGILSLMFWALAEMFESNAMENVPVT